MRDKAFNKQARRIGGRRPTLDEPSFCGNFHKADLPRWRRNRHPAPRPDQIVRGSFAPFRPESRETIVRERMKSLSMAGTYLGRRRLQRPSGQGCRGQIVGAPGLAKDYENIAETLAAFVTATNTRTFGPNDITASTSPPPTRAPGLVQFDPRRPTILAAARSGTYFSRTQPIASGTRVSQAFALHSRPALRRDSNSVGPGSRSPP
jgi:hypothetical protein